MFPQDGSPGWTEKSTPFVSNEVGGCSFKIDKSRQVPIILLKMFALYLRQQLCVVVVDCVMEGLMWEYTANRTSLPLFVSRT